MPSENDESVAEALVRHLAEGTLVPITKIPGLKHVPPATICRWAQKGLLPVLRLGARMLSHPDLVAAALKRMVTGAGLPDDHPQPQGRAKPGTKRVVDAPSALEVPGGV